MNWLLTDMNSYFASVEQFLRPELRGRPIGVIPVQTDSTCVIAASHDAKLCGVKTGTLVPEARRLCPGILFVKARPDLYVRFHRRIVESVESCAPVHRVDSIDEWTIQLRGDDRRVEQARNLALCIKRRLFDEFGPWMTCSIGIAATRLLAKIASNLHKPDGLTILPVTDLPGRLEHLPLKALCGIGDGMRERLHRHGIHTIRDLWNLSREQSIRVWGSVAGAQWWAGFHGEDEPEIPTRRRSMSHGSVLAPQFRNADGAHGIMIRLVCKLAQRLRRHGYVAGGLHISLKEEGGRRHEDRIHLPLIDDTPTLLKQFDILWRRRSSRGVIKKVDVCVTELRLASLVPRSLFRDSEKLQRISQAMDHVNERWGTTTLFPGAVFNCRQHMENKIAFGRIPDEGD